MEVSKEEIMMINKFGSKFSDMRKKKGYTQESISEILGVTAQAVSKWENDLSYPDVALLPEIAKLFNVSIDELLGVTKENEIMMVPEHEKKDINKMILRIIVNSHEGDKVKVNLPISLIKVGLEIGMQMPQVSNNDSLKEIDFKQIMALVESGVIGKIVEIESANGDFVEIIVE
jgi:transcriptional regulator with XRE-family HTH domain